MNIPSGKEFRLGEYKRTHTHYAARMRTISVLKAKKPTLALTQPKRQSGAIVEDVVI